MQHKKNFQSENMTKRWIKAFYEIATKDIDHYLSWWLINYKNNIDFDNLEVKEKFNI